MPMHGRLEIILSSNQIGNGTAAPHCVRSGGDATAVSVKDGFGRTIYYSGKGSEPIQTTLAKLRSVLAEEG